MLAVVSSACCLLTGCYWFHGASKKQLAAEPLPASAWRVAISDEDERALRELAEATPVGSCPELRVDPKGMTLDERQTTPRPARLRTIKAVEWHGGGLLRVWDEPGVTEKEPGPATWFSKEETEWLDIEFNAGYVLPARIEQHEASERVKAAVRKELDVLPSYRPSDARDENLGLGVSLRMPDAVEDDARGLVLYMPALISNTYEYTVVQAMRERGWAMLVVEGTAQVQRPNELDILEAREKQSAHRRLGVKAAVQRDIQAMADGVKPHDLPEPNWFRESHEEAARLYPEPPSGFSYELWDDHAELGRAIAAAVDELLLEYALGAEAAVGLLRERFPSLQGKPIVLMGFSGGSLATPAIAAKLHEAFPDSPMAMVLVGSGGDLLSIALDSDTSNGNIVLAPKGEAVPAAVRAAVVQAYREASQLDPLRAVAAVRHLPLLHVYASGDKAVPTARARELNAAHGQAARITYLGGHFGMFYFLPGQRGRIANWAERAVRKPAS